MQQQNSSFMPSLLQRNFTTDYYRYVAFTKHVSDHIPCFSITKLQTEREHLVMKHFLLPVATLPQIMLYLFLPYYLNVVRRLMYVVFYKGSDYFEIDDYFLRYIYIYMLYNVFCIF